MSKVEAIIKPMFTAPKAIDQLPEQLVTTEESSLAQHVIASYKSLRSEAMNVYDSMLKPLNKKRGVILGWKRDDLADIDTVIESVTLRLVDYRDREDIAREIAAEEALAKAQADAEKTQSEDVEFLEDVADAIEQDDPIAAEHARVEALELRETPAPIIAVIDETLSAEPSSPLSERLRYSATVVDIKVLARAVLDGRISVDALQPNQPWLDRHARSLREEFEVPGVDLSIHRYFVRKSGAS